MKAASAATAAGRGVPTRSPIAVAERGAGGGGGGEEVAAALVLALGSCWLGQRAGLGAASPSAEREGCRRRRLRARETSPPRRRSGTSCEGWPWEGRELVSSDACRPRAPRSVSASLRRCRRARRRHRWARWWRDGRTAEMLVLAERGWAARSRRRRRRRRRRPRSTARSTPRPSPLLPR